MRTPKDGEIAEFVNQLKGTCNSYSKTDQLREQLRRTTFIFLGLLKEEKGNERK